MCMRAAGSNVGRTGWEEVDTRFSSPREARILPTLLREQCWDYRVWKQ